MVFEAPGLFLLLLDKMQAKIVQKAYSLYFPFLRSWTSTNAVTFVLSSRRTTSRSKQGVGSTSSQSQRRYRIRRKWFWSTRCLGTCLLGLRRAKWLALEEQAKLNLRECLCKARHITGFLCPILASCMKWTRIANLYRWVFIIIKGLGHARWRLKKSRNYRWLCHASSHYFIGYCVMRNLRILLKAGSNVNSALKWVEFWL